MTNTSNTTTTNGTEIFIPLNKLKKSPNNARKVKHSDAAIEATAASIAAKGILQNLVVEPETNGEGEPTGFYLVTIGEGRRLAQLLRVKRKEIKKTEPMRCIVDTANDPQEISLDENITREAMHPADEFVAFQELAQRQGYGAEDIAARFGVTPRLVRQRLKLGAVSPRLLQLYREGTLELSEVMAFTLVDDHARQEQVFEQLQDHCSSYAIRRALTGTHVPSNDARALFVGLDAYTEAGGAVLRDLFTEHDDGYLEDVSLLDRLAGEKLAAVAEGIRAEGWKWVDVLFDYPYGHGMQSIRPQQREMTEGEAEAESTARAALEEATAQWDDEDEPSDELQARVAALEADLERMCETRNVYPAEAMATAGALITLSHDGTVRIERGLMRKDDVPTADDETEERKPEGKAAGLSSALLCTLAAHRTLGLRLALGEQPDVALTALTHALVLSSFYFGPRVHCLDISVRQEGLEPHAAGISDSSAAKALAARHAAWQRVMPEDATDLWDVLVCIPQAEQTAPLGPLRLVDRQCHLSGKRPCGRAGKHPAPRHGKPVRRATARVPRQSQQAANPRRRARRREPASRRAHRRPEEGRHGATGRGDAARHGLATRAAASRS
jgi:ParB family chromosome partitioning protein